jgi:hypothetical protein
MNPLLAKGFKASIFGLLRTFGIKTDDIIGAVNGLDIDGMIEANIKTIENETGEEKIVFMLYVENGKAYIRTFAINTLVVSKSAENEEQSVAVLGNSYTTKLLGESKSVIEISGIVKSIVTNIFGLETENKKDKKADNLKKLKQ